MQHISKTTLRFLKDLKANNNRDWFQENKQRYEVAKKEFEAFIDNLLIEIADFDPSIGHHMAKDCVFRIYRDVRFSKDKSPYKTHFGAHITAAAKKSEIHSRAGYYIHVGPGESMLAGGAYLPQGPWLKGIRKELAHNAEEFRSIINNEKFQNYFGDLEGEKLKTAPRDYPKDHPEIELLKYKSFLATHPCKDEEVTATGFLNHATETFRTLYPFDQFLNRVVD